MSDVSKKVKLMQYTSDDWAYIREFDLLTSKVQLYPDTEEYDQISEEVLKKNGYACRLAENGWFTTVIAPKEWEVLLTEDDRMRRRAYEITNKITHSKYYGILEDYNADKIPERTNACLTYVWSKVPAMYIRNQRLKRSYFLLLDTAEAGDRFGYRGWEWDRLFNVYSLISFLAGGLTVILYAVIHS